jgi:hypothetical protein
MPATVSQGIYHHGKRYRFSVTAQDDSDEAFKAALDEMTRQVTEFRSKNSQPSRKQAYRKRKC